MAGFYSPRSTGARTIPDVPIGRRAATRANDPRTAGGIARAAKAGG
jgi:hypothetical protein